MGRRLSGIGAEIKRLRQELTPPLTQEQLADRLGVTQPTISYWENEDGQPSLALLPLLARILGVTVDDLLAATKDSEAEPNPQSAAS